MKNNNVLKSGIWYTISNFIVKGITILSMPIFTRIMSSNDVGAFSNINSWFTILCAITTFDLFTSVMLAKYDFKEDFDKYISSNLFLGTIITSIFYIIVLIFNSYFQKLFSMDIETIHIIFIYLMVYPALQMYQVKNRVEYNYKISSIISIGTSALSVIISLICTITFKNMLRGRIIGFYIPSIIICFIIYVYLMINGKSVSKKYWKYAITISFPLIWHTLANNLLSSCDRVMISNFIGNYENALYTIAYTCAMFVSLLWVSMNTAWSPWAYEMLSKENYSKLNNASKPYFIFFLILVFCFMLFAPEVLLIVGGKDYMSAVYVIPPVMVGYIFQFVYSLYVNIETYYKKQKSIAMATISAAIINIVLNFLFIPKYGYIAAAFTTLIGYVFLFMTHYTLTKKMKKNIYDEKFFFKYLILSIMSIVLFEILYKYIYVRYAIIIITLLLIIIKAIKERNMLLNIIRNKNFNILFDKMGSKNN